MIMNDDWRSWLEPVDLPVIEDAPEQGKPVDEHNNDASASSSHSLPRFPRWLRLVGAAVVLMGLGAGITSVALMKVGSDMRATSVTMTETVTPEVVTTSAAAERCPNQVDADPKDPEGVVVAFQKAYFAADQKKIVALVTEDSYLREVEWVTAVGELKGSTWCVVTKKEPDSTVAASVTVRTSAGEEQIYIQTYTVAKVKDVWRIVSIEDREET